TDRAWGTGGAVRLRARWSADGALQRRGGADAVRDSRAGGSGSAILGKRRAGAGSSTERGGSVGARGSGVGIHGARSIHRGRIGKRTGRGGESRWDAERSGFRCEPGFGAVPLCHGRGADLARGSGRKTGGGAAAP